MSKEANIPLQLNMLTGEWEDNRTRRQRELDQERTHPQQIEMFSQREVAQFGVNPRPLLPLSPNTKLGLMFEDPRTEEEKEQDRQREAESRTYQLFERPTETGGQTPIAPDTETLAMVICKVPCLALTVIEQVSRALIRWEAA